MHLKKKNFTSPVSPNAFHSYVAPFECKVILDICPPSWSKNPLCGMFRSHNHYIMHILHSLHFSVTLLLKSLNLWSSSSGVLLGGMSAEQLLNVIAWLFFILHLTFSFWRFDLYEARPPRVICPFLFLKPNSDGVSFLRWPFGFLPLHFRLCAICWFIYYEYFSASARWHHWFTVLKKRREVWDAMFEHVQLPMENASECNSAINQWFKPIW